jgi:hypothetical protein
MWNPFRSRPARMPTYSALEDRPDWPAPTEIRCAEEEAWRTDHAATMAALLAGPGRPPDDAPRFVTLLSAHGDGLVTIPGAAPEGASCLPVFSSPIRAGDYARAVFGREDAGPMLVSSPTDLTRMAGDLPQLGIETITLDRCPRCRVVAQVVARQLTTPAAVLEWWAVHAATERLRVTVWLDYIRRVARAGELFTARDVALQMTAHVTLDDPRVHFLLGQVALALDDRTTLRQAAAMLAYVGCDPWAAALRALGRTGRPTPGFAVAPDGH